MKNGLKDCPFCGGRPIIIIRGSQERSYTVECQNNCTNQKDSREEARDSWNNRKEDFIK